jgi:hypothetical protein
LETASKRRCKKSTKVYEEGKGKRVICWNLNLMFGIIDAAVMLWHFPFVLFWFTFYCFYGTNQKLKVVRERMRSYFFFLTLLID